MGSVVKANYVPMSAGGAEAARRSADYYAHRPDEEGHRRYREAFDSTNDSMSKGNVHSVLDYEAPDSEYMYRMVVSPGEDMTEDELRDYVRDVMEPVEEDGGSWMGWVHEDQTEHIHAHLICYTDERLEVDDFAEMRSEGDEHIERVELEETWAEGMGYESVEEPDEDWNERLRPWAEWRAEQDAAERVEGTDHLRELDEHAEGSSGAVHELMAPEERREAAEQELEAIEKRISETVPERHDEYIKSGEVPPDDERIRKDVEEELGADRVRAGLQKEIDHADRIGYEAAAERFSERGLSTHEAERMEQAAERTAWAIADREREEPPGVKQEIAYEAYENLSEQYRAERAHSTYLQDYRAAESANAAEGSSDTTPNETQLARIEAAQIEDRVYREAQVLGKHKMDLPADHRGELVEELREAYQADLREAKDDAAARGLGMSEMYKIEDQVSRDSAYIIANSEKGYSPEDKLELEKSLRQGYQVTAECEKDRRMDYDDAEGKMKEMIERGSAGSIEERLHRAPSHGYE